MIFGSIAVSALVCALYHAYMPQGAFLIGENQNPDELRNKMCIQNFATFVGVSTGLSLAVAIVLRLLQKLLRLPFLAALILWTILFVAILVVCTDSFTALVR